MNIEFQHYYNLDKRNMMSKSPADISSRPIIQPIIPYFSDIEYDPLKYGGCRNPVDI